MTTQKSCVLDIESTGLQPWDSYIICIGTRDADTGKTIVFYNEDEKELLIEFLDYYHRNGFNEIIGYNVSFDIRFIFARCLKYGLNANGFFRSNVIDLMQTMRTGIKIYGSYNRPGRLDEWAALVFNDGKIPLPDSMEKLFAQGRIDEIIRYNKKDVELTFKLYQRVKEVLGNDM